MSKTPWKRIVSDSDYLSEADFDEGEEKTATIDRVKSSVKIQSAEGASEKAVIFFRENIKPMILNVARSKAITRVSGSKFVEDWPGTVIQLYIDDNVKAFGTTVSAVRVRPNKPVIRNAIKCTDCGRDIPRAMGKGTDYIAAYTKKRYGTPLCPDCASTRAKLAQKATRATEQEGDVINAPDEADN